MILEELKTIIEKTVEIHKDCLKSNVVITIKKPSIGPRGSVVVNHVGLGFDWESGQFRIEPGEQLTLVGRAKDDIIPPRMAIYNNRKHYSCSICEQQINKDDKYCKRCGQKISN